MDAWPKTTINKTSCQLRYSFPERTDWAGAALSLSLSRETVRSVSLFQVRRHPPGGRKNIPCLGQYSDYAHPSVHPLERVPKQEAITFREKVCSSSSSFFVCAPSSIISGSFVKMGDVTSSRHQSERDHFVFWKKKVSFSLAAYHAETSRTEIHANSRLITNESFSLILIHLYCISHHHLNLTRFKITRERKKDNPTRKKIFF